MKSYGHNRYEKRVCRYGCCAVRKGNRHAESRVICDRRARKAARQDGRGACRDIDG